MADRYKASSIEKYLKDSSPPAHTQTTHPYPYSQKNLHSPRIFQENLVGLQGGSQRSLVDYGSRSKDETTDRFIPNRKLLRKEVFKEERPVSPSENQPEHQDSSLVPQLFKRYVMQDSGKERDKEIRSYQNANMFRYVQRPQSSTQEQPVRKPPGLEFSDQLAKYRQSQRKISRQPVKVLDAPALQDDYYLNLLDWSPFNFLAVGLATSVYLWNAGNAQVTRLCDLGIHNMAASVACHPREPIMALGTSNGEVHIWDTERAKKVRSFTNHSMRVGTMAWSSNLLTTGSRDKTIVNQDYRAHSASVSKLNGHKQQICGLKWSYDEQQLCSGGNDNRLMVWNTHATEPLYKFSDHKAAVKAMAWSPHQHGLLVSGGGTADRTIKFRNALTGQTISSHDVGSQVCNVMFSRSVNEIVSTHGYSQNEINIWRAGDMHKISTLTGHAYRVLYLAMSPDGSTIVTGAGDETLRFWSVFPSSESMGHPAEILSCPSLR